LSSSPGIQNTYLIAGLGNPGREYRNNRHNVGFMFLDGLSERLGISFTRMQSKSLISDGRYEGQKIILTKPQTYMNSSGKALSGLVNFYKLPLDNLLVVYDDVDIPFGTLRLRSEGGSGGHKGMRSIIAKLDTRGFSRMRIGIGRPPGRMEAADYVLRDFTQTEFDLLPEILERAADAALSFATNGIERTMTMYNRTNE
jgi:PTH1 family peptidyl-tRNA hydrolase